jgi:hypothetical protein
LQKSEAKAAPKEDTKEKYDESDYPEFDSKQYDGIGGGVVQAST